MLIEDESKLVGGCDQTSPGAIDDFYWHIRSVRCLQLEDYVDGQIVAVAYRPSDQFAD